METESSYKGNSWILFYYLDFLSYIEHIAIKLFILVV